MEIKEIDIHNHTYGSDGKQFPLRLLNRAYQANCNIISLTDHNSVKGYELMEKQISSILTKAEQSKYKDSPKMFQLYQKVIRLLEEVKILKGIEIISTYKGTIIEILGYNIDTQIMQQEI